MANYQLNVNGKQQQVDATPDMPLLWVLRDVLNLTGTKYGCGIGSCGSCAVMIDGVAVKSCQMPVSEVGSKKITTIEGLSVDGSNPVQRAWIEEDVAQCGYCQGGQIIAAAALLKKHPRPTEAQINEAMSEHLCRCGTYVRVKKAIQRAATGGVK